jgi:DMSO/TMAO reductase YedYZ molybdopterin-dependent catalytic subunit
MIVSRRKLLLGAAAGTGALILPGCDAAVRSPTWNTILSGGEKLTYGAQRALQFGQPLAREFSERDLSPVFRANGTTHPDTPEYNAMLVAGFSNWRLQIDGLVERPQSYSLADLRALPSRTQITRHDCVEGWSAIGRWKGAQLAQLLMAAGLKPNARFALFHCADDLDKTPDGLGKYYETSDLIDCFHPQTILAYELNHKPLDVAHGAPVRMRIERALGYKQPKYLMRIEMIERFDHLGKGKGGYWEDRGYEWYGGI